MEDMVNKEAVRKPDDYCRAVTGHSREALTAIVHELAGDKGFSSRIMAAEFAPARKEHRIVRAHHNRVMMKQGSNSR
jgi:hypothetical protein